MMATIAGHAGFTQSGSIEVDPFRLDQLVESQAETYRNADPFPHIVIDDFVDAAMLEAVAREVQCDSSAQWDRMDDRFQRKFANNSTKTMGPNTRALINFMNGQEIIGFLEQLTGIDGLIADWQLAGGGIHALRDGGYLNVHADFNYHRHLKLDRRINLLIYLNKDWEEDFGGCLELWDTKMEACRKRILPSFNRCVIFNTTDDSFHGNPVPVQTPDGRTRWSLAFYYYTAGRPKAERSDEHATIFKAPRAELTVKDRVRAVSREVTPPIINRWLRRRGL